MLDTKDLAQLQKKGICPQQVTAQLESLKKGFPFLKLEKVATVGNGILRIESDEINQYLSAWDNYLMTNKTVLKFVPASGAASRMFKDLFEFIEAPYQIPTTAFEKKFFSDISDFAFYDDLDAVCAENEAKTIPLLIEEGKYKQIVENLLQAKGLNYGALPKGLLQFHKYADKARTAMEEHLVEGALYASSNGVVNLHFTVSAEHKEFFMTLVKKVQPIYEKKFCLKYNISFSEQKPSTDTIAADKDNNPFREDNKILFRPGGHGALIENLNDIDADVIFIKNIDNVVPDRLKDETIKYKKLIAGVLITLQKQINEYVMLLESGKYTIDQLREIIRFVQNELMVRNPKTKEMEDAQLALYLLNKLRRPLRICGMVKNAGEPGGGPFLAYNADGSYSLQILESSQIDINDPIAKEMMKGATHFNPVDLVCAVKDFKGKKYDLPQFTDPSTGFISLKSKNGKELKALELPGLWNGAMSNWNTIFVEVPIETFNPVKNVNDLLREQHQ